MSKLFIILTLKKMILNFSIILYILKLYKHEKIILYYNHNDLFEISKKQKTVFNYYNE